jgi:superkiller protein 3
MIFASAAVFWLFERFSKNSLKQFCLSATVVAVIAFYVNKDSVLSSAIASRRVSYLVLGILYEEKNHFQKAEEMYSKSLAVDPDYDLGNMRLGKLYDKLGRTSAAQQLFRKVVSKKHIDSRVFKETSDFSNIRKISKYYKQKKYDMVIKLSREMLEADPDDSFRYYNNIGLALYKQGRYSQAIDEYKRSAGLNPEYAVVYYNMGLAYLKTEDVLSARENFKKCLQIDPGYFKAKDKLDEINNFDRSTTGNKQ